MAYLYNISCLAQRSKTLFETLNNQGRQKLLRFLLSNCTLYDKKLEFEVNDPYKTFIEINTKKQNEGKNKSWCHSLGFNQIVDTVVNAAIELQDDCLLKDLAEDFNLSSELLTV